MDDIDGRTAEVVTCQPALPQILLVAPKAHCLRVEASLLVLSSTRNDVSGAVLRGVSMVAVLQQLASSSLQVA